MNHELDQTLSQAYELIEADKLDEAQNLLKPLLDTHKDDPDLWWLYAHAVTDKTTAKHALQQVLRIDPAYQSAAVLIQRLEGLSASPEASPDQAASSTMPEPDFLPDLPEVMPAEWEAASKTSEFDFISDEIAEVGIEGLEDEDDFESMLDDDAGRAGRPRPAFRRRALLTMSLLGILVFIGIIAIALLTSQSPAEQLAPPQSADNDLTPADQQATVTLESPSVSAEGRTGEVSDYANYYEALKSLAVKENGIATTNTALGNTLVAQICTLPGPEMRQALPQAMDALAGAAEDALPSADAVGVDLLDCSDGDRKLLFIGVQLSDALAYARGEITAAEFSARWKPL